MVNTMSAFEDRYPRHFVALSNAAREIQRTTGEQYMFMIRQPGSSITPDGMIIDVWSDSCLAAEGLPEEGVRGSLRQVNIEKRYLLGIPFEGGGYVSAALEYARGGESFRMSWNRSTRRATISLSAPPVQ